MLALVHAGRALAIVAVALGVATELAATAWLPVVLVAATVEGALATLNRPGTMSLMPSLARSGQRQC